MSVKTSPIPIVTNLIIVASDYTMRGVFQFYIATVGILLWTPLKISSERFKLILVDRENPSGHSQFCQRGLQKCSLCVGTICATFSLLLEAVASPGLQDA